MNLTRWEGYEKPTSRFTSYVRVVSTNSKSIQTPINECTPGIKTTPTWRYRRQHINTLLRQNKRKWKVTVTYWLHYLLDFDSAHCILSYYAVRPLRLMYGCLRSSFTIYNRTVSTVQCARSPHIPRARAPYTVYQYGNFIFITFPSCFLSKGQNRFYSLWVGWHNGSWWTFVIHTVFYLNSKCPLGTNMVLRAGWNSPRVFNSFCSNCSFLNLVLMHWCRDEVREPVGNPVGWDI